MPWYKCSVVGEGFPGVIVGKSVPIGFYTTRYVEANSIEDAETLALNILKAEPQLQLPEGTQKPTSARVTFENIVEIETPLTPIVQHGFAFFEMGS
ncbi:MAG: hypothetical protein AB1899_03640 [Pseudomonadota bacterium]